MIGFVNLISIQSIFYSAQGDIDPMNLLKQKCRVTAVIKFESVRIAANSVTLQVKLYEAKIKLLNTSLQRMMIDDESRSESRLDEMTTETSNMFQSLIQTQAESKSDDSEKDDGNDNDKDNDNGSDEEPKTPDIKPKLAPPPSAPKKPRVVNARKK